MALLSSFNHYVNILLVCLFLILSVGGGAAFYFLKIKKVRSKKENIDYSHFERKDSLEYVKLDTSHPQFWLEDLYRRGVTSVMVEGGTRVLQELIDAGTWDEARIEVSPRTVGQGVTAPVIDGQIASRELIDGNTITLLRPATL